MRILFLDQFSEMGGAQRMLVSLLEAVRARGWSARVGLPGEGALLGAIGGLGFESTQISCGPYSLGRKSAADVVRFTCQLPHLAGQIRQQAQEFRPDLVYVNGPRVLPAAALAGLAVPVLFHAHSSIPAGLIGKLAGWAVRRLRAEMIASCRFVAKPWARFAEGPVAVIWNGVAGPDKPHYQPHPESPRIGCIGRISPEKGQLEFLQAAEILHHELPRCRFVIYGAPLFSSVAATYAERVRAAAAGLPVELPGWTADVYSALACLDLLLVPSASFEATTRVVLESGAAGVPVIAFRAGGIPEVVENGRTGFLADSVQEMAECAVSLLRGDPARLRAISEAAREHWCTRFTAARWQREMLEQMERAAN